MIKQKCFNIIALRLLASVFICLHNSKCTRVERGEKPEEKKTEDNNRHKLSITICKIVLQPNAKTKTEKHNTNERCRKGNHLIILNFQLRCLQLPQTALVARGAGLGE